VEADTYQRSMGAVTADLKAELASLERPTGISASFGADVEERAKAFRERRCGNNRFVIESCIRLLVG